MERVRARILTAILCLVAVPAFASAEDDIRSTFETFVVAQNSHDAGAVKEVLLDSPAFLWVTRGNAIRGREAAMKRFETLYQGTWKLSPDMAGLKVALLNESAAHLTVPVTFKIGATGQAAPDAPFILNQTLVKGASDWRIANILPIPLPAPSK